MVAARIRSRGTRAPMPMGACGAARAGCVRWRPRLPRVLVLAALLALGPLGAAGGREKRAPVIPGGLDGYVQGLGVMDVSSDEFYHDADYRPTEKAGMPVEMRKMIASAEEFHRHTLADPSAQVRPLPRPVAHAVHRCSLPARCCRDSCRALGAPPLQDRQDERDRAKKLELPKQRIPRKIWQVCRGAQSPPRGSGCARVRRAPRGGAAAACGPAPSPSAFPTLWHARAHARARTHTHTHTHARTRTHAHTHARTHTHTYTHTHVRCALASPGVL